MGGLDKPLLRLSGATLLERIAGRLRPQTDRLALSANGDPGRFACAGLVVLADETPGLGPLAGVLSGLEWGTREGCEFLVTVAGDTPFIPTDLVRRLMPAPSVASSGGRVHHTAALWPVACRARLRAHLQGDGNRSVFGFASGLGMREVVFADAPIDPFFNINRPADLTRAEIMVAEPWSPDPRPG